jgi:hypothetical protein
MNSELIHHIRAKSKESIDHGIACPGRNKKRMLIAESRKYNPILIMRSSM